MTLEEKRASRRKYYHKNKEIIREKLRLQKLARTAEDKQKICEYRHAHYQKNREEILARQRVYGKIYYARNRTVRLTKQKEYYIKKRTKHEQSL